jgi:hypothetical protein
MQRSKYNFFFLDFYLLIKGEFLPPAEELLVVLLLLLLFVGAGLLLYKNCSAKLPPPPTVEEDGFPLFIANGEFVRFPVAVDEFAKKEVEDDPRPIPEDVVRVLLLLRIGDPVRRPAASGEF